MTSRALVLVYTTAITLVACGGETVKNITETTVISPDGGVLVTPAQCEEDVDCDNGVYCDGAETCNDGLCAQGELVTCDDGVECTRDACSEATQGCEFVGTDADGDGHIDATCEDADGVALGDDCDDGDPARFPGNIEVCDMLGVDEDCDTATFGTLDFDLDGYVDAVCCNGDNCGLDCDDARRGIHPDAGETCDGFDNDCDVLIDEGLTTPKYVDADGDGYGAEGTDAQDVCPSLGGFAESDGDCDDGNLQRSPGLFELCADGQDNDCDGEVDEAENQPATWYRDFDGDGFGDMAGGELASCEVQPGFSLHTTDCNDADDRINPAAPERCNAIDDDCDGDMDFIIGPDNFEDDDRDGAPDPWCGLPRVDCAENDDTIYPGARELCDGVDNDCNGIIDSLDEDFTWFRDDDGDGYGQDGDTKLSCELQPGWALEGGDCNDASPAQSPSVADDCSGEAGVDDDCDGSSDEAEQHLTFYIDEDADGYGAGTELSACTLPAGVAQQGGDCDDMDGLLNPAVLDDCSGLPDVDDNCDGNVDEAIVLVDFYRDDDGDGFGAGEIISGCAPPDGFVADAGDCDEVDPDIHPGADELCATPDGIDNDCDGATDCDDPDCWNGDDCGGGFGITLVNSPPGGFVTQVIDPVMVTLRDEVGAPVVGATLTFGPPRGAVLTAADPVTDGNGQVAMQLQFGRRAGDHDFTVSSVGYMPLVFTATSLDPPDESIVTVFNTTHVSALVVGQGPAVIRSTDYIPEDIDGAPDGTLYVAMGYRGVSEIDPDGHFRRISTAANADLIAYDGPGNAVFVADATTIQRIDLATGQMELYAGGGPSTGNGGPARSAKLSIIDLEAGPDGALYLWDNVAGQIRRIDPQTQVVDAVYYFQDCSQVGPQNTSTYVALAFSPDDVLFMGTYACPGSNQFHLLRMVPITDINGKITGFEPPQHAGGRTHVEPFIDNWHVDDNSLGLVAGLAMDSQGNFYVAPEWNPNWGIIRVDGTSGRATQLVSDTGGGGARGDFGTALDATLTNIGKGVWVSPAGDLYVIDGGGRAIRRVVGVERPGEQVTVNVTQGGTQSRGPNARIEAVGVEIIAGGTPLGGADLVLDFDHPGGWMLAEMRTDLSGVTGITGFVGRLAGDFTLTLDMLGPHQSSSGNASVDITVTPPQPGIVHPLHHAEFAGSGSVSSSVLTRPAVQYSRPIYNMIVAPDGGVYASETTKIVYFDTDGVAHHIAGTGTTATVGDGGAAAVASLSSPRDLALDPGNRLFIKQTDVIRVVDLQTGLIDTLDTLPNLGITTLIDMEFVDGLLWLVYHEGTGNPRIYGVDPDTLAVTPILTDSVGSVCTSSEVLYLHTVRDIAPDGAGGYYFGGLFCGSMFGTVGGNGAYGVVHFDGNGWSQVVGQYNGVTSLGGVPASSNLVRASPPVTVSPDGTVYFSEYINSRGYIRYVDGNGMVQVLVGEGGGPILDQVPVDTIEMAVTFNDLQFDASGQFYFNAQSNRIQTVAVP